MLALSLALALASPDALLDAAVDDIVSLELALDIFEQPGLQAQDEGPPAPAPPTPPKPPASPKKREDRATKPVASTSTLAAAGSSSTPQGRQIGIGLQL